MSKRTFTISFAIFTLLFVPSLIQAVTLELDECSKATFLLELTHKDDEFHNYINQNYLPHINNFIEKAHQLYINACEHENSDPVFIQFRQEIGKQFISNEYEEIREHLNHLPEPLTHTERLYHANMNALAMNLLQLATSEVHTEELCDHIAKNILFNTGMTQLIEIERENSHFSNHQEKLTSFIQSCSNAPTAVNTAVANPNIESADSASTETNYLPFSQNYEGNQPQSHESGVEPVNSEGNHDDTQNNESNQNDANSEADSESNSKTVDSLVKVASPAPVPTIAQENKASQVANTNVAVANVSNSNVTVPVNVSISNSSASTPAAVKAQQTSSQPTSTSSASTKTSGNEAQVQATSKPSEQKVNNGDHEATHNEADSKDQNQETKHDHHEANEKENSETKPDEHTESQMGVMNEAKTESDAANSNKASSTTNNTVSQPKKLTVTPVKATQPSSTVSKDSSASSAVKSTAVPTSVPTTVPTSVPTSVNQAPTIQTMTASNLPNTVTTSSPSLTTPTFTTTSVPQSAQNGLNSLTIEPLLSNLNLANAGQEIFLPELGFPVQHLESYQPPQTCITDRHHHVHAELMAHVDINIYIKKVKKGSSQSENDDQNNESGNIEAVQSESGFQQEAGENAGYIPIQSSFQQEAGENAGYIPIQSSQQGENLENLDLEDIKPFMGQPPAVDNSQEANSQEANDQKSNGQEANDQEANDQEGNSQTYEGQSNNALPFENQDIYGGYETEGGNNGECAGCDSWAGAGSPNRESEANWETVPQSGEQGNAEAVPFNGELDGDQDGDFALMTPTAPVKTSSSNSNLLKPAASAVKASPQKSQIAGTTQSDSNKASNLNAQQKQKSKGLKNLLQSLFGFGEDDEDDGSKKKGLLASLGLDFGGLL